MLVDESGQFVTQREEPRMSQIQLSSMPDGFEASFEKDSPRPDRIRSLQRVRVWKDELDAIVCRSEVNEWFSNVLERPVRLVRMGDDCRRLVDQEFAGANDIVSFAMGFHSCCFQKRRSQS